MITETNWNIDKDEMIIRQKKRLLELDSLLPLPPTYGCFRQNLIYMYKKGINDAIMELQRINNQSENSLEND